MLDARLWTAFMGLRFASLWVDYKFWCFAVANLGFNEKEQDSDSIFVKTRNYIIPEIQWGWTPSPRSFPPPSPYWYASEHYTSAA